MAICESAIPTVEVVAIFAISGTLVPILGNCPVVTGVGSLIEKVVCASAIPVLPTDEAAGTLTMGTLTTGGRSVAVLGNAGSVAGTCVSVSVSSILFSWVLVGPSVAPILNLSRASFATKVFQAPPNIS